MQKFLLFGAMCATFWACQNPEPVNTKPTDIKLVGKTMGSGYSVQYKDNMGRNFKSEIDSFLADFDKQVSTYRNDSYISRFNQSTELSAPADSIRHLYDLVSISREIYLKSNKYFNPAVKPLVNYWGFGYKEKKPLTEANPKIIDSLLKVINYEDIISKPAENNILTLSKTNPKVQVEFNAIAPGYAADIIAKFLDEKQIPAYLVEIGGEIKAKGYFKDSTYWKVGINTPTENVDIDDIKTIVQLPNISLATSGNYRNFYTQNGKKYVHTINPKTGYTEQNSLLSVSVFTKSCADADAFATAFMAMGIERALPLAESLKELQVYFIYADSTNNLQEKYTNGAESLFLK